ncbi:hypothetical protein ACIPWL_07535 [Streptomyces sp. NPDC090023]|uniref:hypothetical protein n=1 Tax=unclassified Streptomyces TaxID=2593676 RepID=UPI003819EE30
MTDRQHKDDLGRVSQQNSATDMARGVEDGPRGGLLDGLVRAAFDATPFGRAVSGRTDFDKRDLDLNKMIDLVEETDPADLESSGKALWDARDAVKAAADELDGHIDQVHWVGESGDAFRKWGAKLVTNTHHLSDFAGAAGDQITAAAVGLSSVRGAMPARDTQAGRKRPEHFTAAEKTADKDAYDAAVKVEKNRQEAINQMNRLASYYAVSEEVLASLPAEDKMPEFTSMPDVGVPQPQRQFAPDPVAPVTGSGGGNGDGHTSGTRHHSAAVGHITTHVSDTSPAPHTNAGHHTSPVDVPVGTNIDSVGTLPAPATASAPHVPSVPSANPAGDGQPMTGGAFGFPASGRGPVRATNGATGLRDSWASQRRSGTSNALGNGSGRAGGQSPANQMGRAKASGQSGPDSGTKSPMTGRAAANGTSRAPGSPAGRPNGMPSTGAARSNGVVGGRPTQTGAGAPKSGPRIPRGTVVGTEGTPNPRAATGGPGQRSSFGALESASKPGSGATGSRSRSGSPQAITGRLGARVSTAATERNGMTQGGTGLVRTNRKKKSGDDETRASSRPDYLIEDDETHLSEKHRRDTPPVVD